MPWNVSRLFPLLTASALLYGCASTSQIHIRSTSQTNDGNTLYVMARTTERAVASENYHDAASKVFAEPQDPSVIYSQPLFPGNVASITLEDQKKDVVLYFFFTEPGSNWRLPLPKPLPSEVYIDLGQHQIERVQVRRRLESASPPSPLPIFVGRGRQQQKRETPGSARVPHPLLLPLAHEDGEGAGGRGAWF